MVDFLALYSVSVLSTSCLILGPPGLPGPMGIPGSPGHMVSSSLVAPTHLSIHSSTHPLISPHIHPSNHPSIHSSIIHSFIQAFMEHLICKLLSINLFIQSM